MTNFEPFNHFGFLTIRISRLIDISLDEKIKSKGYHFPTSCVGILADLWNKDGVSQKELGSSMIKMKSSVTKMLEALENEKMIVKRNDSKDRRKRLIFLTEKGRDFQSDLEEKSKQFELSLMNESNKEEIIIAKNVLKIFYNKLKDGILKES